MTHPEPRAALEEEREFLLGSLRDLEREHDSGEIDESDYLTLREDYTARAAAVLRELEVDEVPAEGATRVRRGPRARAARQSGEPRARQSGEPRARQSGGPRARAARQSGGHRVRRNGAGSAARAQPRAYVIGVLLAVLVGVPIGILLSTDEVRDDATAMAPAGALGQARALAAEGKAAEALKLYDGVLATQPDNVEALAHRGWLLALAGLVDPAMQSLDRAVAVDPGYPDARFFRGMVLYRQRNDPAAAIPEFEAFLAGDPPADTVPAVQNELNRARDAAANATTPPGG